MKRLQTIFLVLTISFIIGMIMGYQEFGLSGWFIVLFITIFLTIVVLYSILSTKKMMTLLKEGRYDECIELSEKMLTNYPNQPKAKNQIIYNIALIHNRKGDFAESNEALEQIELKYLDKNLKAVYFGLFATNLLILEKDVDRAIGFIRESIDLYNNSSSYLIWACLEQLGGNSNYANELVEKYNKTIDDKKFKLGMTPLLIDKQFKEVFDHFLLGLYHLRAGENEESRKHFFIASSYTVPNFYSEEASRLLRREYHENK